MKKREPDTSLVEVSLAAMKRRGEVLLLEREVVVEKTLRKDSNYCFCGV